MRFSSWKRVFKFWQPSKFKSRKRSSAFCPLSAHSARAELQSCVLDIRCESFLRRCCLFNGSPLLQVKRVCYSEPQIFYRSTTSFPLPVSVSYGSPRWNKVVTVDVVFANSSSFRLHLLQSFRFLASPAFSPLHRVVGFA